MAKKLIDTDIKLGKGTLLLEALEDLGIDFPIEWGESSNGSWEKWNSGKLVQRGKFTATNGTTQPQGGIYRSANVQTQSFPIPFVDRDIELFLDTNGPGAFDVAFNSISNVAFSFRLIHFLSQNVNTPVVYKAIGRWK